MRGDEQSASVVILETGASWPKLAHELQKSATHAIVESQASSESASQFERRVLARLASLRAEGVVVEMAVYATNERVDASTRAVRQRLGRAIASAMSSGEGELIFSAAEHVAEEVRHHLLSLAGTLIDELGGSPIGVRVRFTSASQSAIRAVRPSDPDILAGSA